MSEDKGLSKAEIRLAYIKTFIWPGFALAFLILFYRPVNTMLSNDLEVEMFGVRLAGSAQSVLADLERKADTLESRVVQVTEDLEKANQLNINLSQQNDSLINLLDQNTALDSEEAKTLASLKNNSSELQLQTKQLAAQSEKNVAKTRKAANSKEFEMAKENEEVAFNALMQGKYDAALKGFLKTEEVSPGYGNAKELADLLNKNMDALLALDPNTRSSARQNILNIILNQYDWGLDPITLRLIEQELDQNK